MAQITGTTGPDTLLGTAGDDTLQGLAGGDVLSAVGGDDWLEGGTGQDWLTGGSGADAFAFRDPLSNANRDNVADFVSGIDKIWIDPAVAASIGALGNFAVDDERFYAAPGARTPLEADDRIIYDTSTGMLMYDPDGSGPAGQQFIAQLRGAPALTATDIAVIGATGSQPIVGTEGDDSLTGTPGDDTIDGLGGNDTIDGAGGNDLLIGGAGNDLLFGGEQHTPEDSHDTLDGGSGDDVFNIFTTLGTSQNVVLLDGGGVDTVIASSWTLGAGFENLTLRGGQTEGGTGVGNALANLIHVESNSNDLFQVQGGDGNDTLLGGEGSEILRGDGGDDWLEPGIDGAEADTLTGGAGQDSFVFRAPPVDSAFGDSVTDFSSPADQVLIDNRGFTAVGGAGTFTAGDARFAANASGTATDASHRIIYNTSTGELSYDADGAGGGAAVLFARLEGAPALAASDITVLGDTPPAGEHIAGTSGSDALVGTAGNDTLEGLAGGDLLDGRVGNDRLEGGAGQDRITGGDGEDSFTFRTPLNNANRDTVNDFVSGTDRILLDDAVAAAVGALGDFESGDERFYAGPGARAPLEADDRIVYDTTSGMLMYDPDGSGGAGQQFITVLQGAPALSASDIAVI
jgi:Ca2+-binding RTX toxin-like protein